MALERGDGRREPVACRVENCVPFGVQRLAGFQVGAHGALHFGATQTREVHGRRPHCARGADDEELRAFADARLLERVPRGHIRHAAGCGLRI